MFNQVGHFYDSDFVFIPENALTGHRVQFSSKEQFEKALVKIFT